MDPLEQSRVFLDCFKTNVNPADPLPVRVPIYNLKFDEIEPAIIDWSRTYLDQFGCPQCILAPIIRQVLEAVLSYCKENPKSCGFTGQDYKTLQLNQEVISRVNRICTELLDNEKLNNLLAQVCEDQPDSAIGAITGRKFHFSRGLKHRRRIMEDRHVCLPDFNKLFCTRDTEPTAFYGVYDGHGGQEAASFAASHLHYYIAQSEHYPHDMEKAFRDAFLKTDRLFLEKCENHHLNSGSTAVVCVHHLLSKKIDIAWVGDSQAILIKRTPGAGVFRQLVHPTHVASDPNERERIHAEGGSVIPWSGQFRVSGQLAITRAFGNRFYKPFVCAEPVVSLNQCTDDDLLLVMASDGLWEGYDEYLISLFVLYAIRKFADDPQKVTDYLITFAKQKTKDNITVIIVFLKDPQTIIKDTPFIEELEAKAKVRSSQNMEINGATNNGLLSENASIRLEDHKAFEDIQSFMVESSALLEPKSASALCVGPVDDMGFLSDGGLGPETDVDGLHDSKQPSPSPLLDGVVKSPELDNGDIIEHEDVNVERVEHTVDQHNPFHQNANDVLLDSPGNIPEEVTNDFEEEEPTSPSSVSVEPVDLSEEQQPMHAIPHVNGNGEHHFDEPADAEELLGAMENEEAETLPTLKAELNAEDMVPLKSLDEPIVNDLLGGDSIVDNKLIDQLDSFGISEAIRRQLIDQQVTGAAMHHEQDEDDDDGQLLAEEKHSDFDGVDDGAEKVDLHHEKAFDSEYTNDHHSADVKQDDDAGCCEDSEEDEWDYVKVNQQQQRQEQESQPTVLEKHPETTPSEDIVNPFEYANSFSPNEPLAEHTEQHREEELEQHQEPAQFVEEKEQQQELVQQGQEEEPLDETPALNTSEPEVVDILGDNTESVVAESAKEADDVISVGGETKEVVNLLNDFREDVPTDADTVCDTYTAEEPSFETVPFVPSGSAIMEASMYGEPVAEQPFTPESPTSPLNNFQQEQVQQQEFTQEKDLFGSSMNDAMSPSTEDEEMNEKHLYEAEEKTMNSLQGAGAGGDMGWQLNPEAKEFVPITGATAGGDIHSKLHENIKMRDDVIVAQSPRKGALSSMEDLEVPAEMEFQTEMDKRPHEFAAFGETAPEDTTQRESLPRSPIATNPFDLSILNDNTVVEHPAGSNGIDMVIGVGDYLTSNNGVDLLHSASESQAQFGADENASLEELELLNKVQQLPQCEEDEPQEALITAQSLEPMQAAGDEFEDNVKETYSAKEELHVEQKETVDESITSAELLVQRVENLTFEHVQENAAYDQEMNDQIPKSVLSDISQSPEFKMLESSMQQQQEQMLLDNKSISDALLNAQEPTAPAEQLVGIENEQHIPSFGSNFEKELIATVEPVAEEKPLEVAAPKAEEQPTAVDTVEELKPTEPEQGAGVIAATAVVAATATAAAAAALSAPSKAVKSKSPVAAPAAKKTATSATGKASSTVSKDSAAAKSAPRVGSSTTAPAARKPPVSVAKKAPTASTAKTATGAATTNGVKEPRPVSATASKPALATKKPTTDVAKTAPTRPTASVPAARTKPASAPSSSTTKPASASSTARTTAPKPATTGTTVGAKTSTRLSATTTTRTVTSRPSSAVSGTSVPAKTSTTTTTTVKKTATTKSAVTNGISTTDGTKTTKTSTTSSTVPRVAASRAAGTGVAAKPSSTIGAKKPLDTKPAAATTKAASATSTLGTKTTATRTSLAPKTSATSPSVRKVQQNGVAKKSTTAASPGVKKQAGTTTSKAVQKPQPVEPLPEVPSPMTDRVDEINGTTNGSADAAPTPTPQAVDQLLVPVPQAM